jgi:hypothetical protein
MNQQFSTDSFSKLTNGGFYGPEVMATLKRIFDLICKEAEIPVNATAERNWLARQMLAAWSTNPDGAGLIHAARKAVADYRK